MGPERISRGTSLIEILVGTVILALIMIPAMNVIGGGTKAVVGTKDQNQAIFIAQQLMEKARAWEFDMLDIASLPANGDAEKTLEGRLKEATNKYRLRIYNINGVEYEVRDFKVTKLPPGNEKKLMATVSFSIFFKGKDGKNHGPLEFYSSIPK